jgi:hypothetical protein
MNRKEKRKHFGSQGRLLRRTLEASFFSIVVAPKLPALLEGLEKFCAVQRSFVRPRNSVFISIAFRA